MAGKLAERNEEIIRQYVGGKSSYEIADIFGLSQVHISRIIKAARLTRSASESKKLSHSKPEVKAKLSASFKGRKCPEHVKEILRGRKGSANHNWRAGLTISSQGYLHFTASEANGQNALKPVHKVVAEWKIGRKLNDGEHVHHIDGNKLNNDPNNLEVLNHSDHARIHAIKSNLGKHKRASNNA